MKRKTRLKMFFLFPLCAPDNLPAIIIPNCQFEGCLFEERIILKGSSYNRNLQKFFDKVKRYF